MHQDNMSEALQALAAQFFQRNYDYLWLRTMLEQAGSSKIPGSTLITGSSHALNGVKESCWNRAFNCSRSEEHTSELQSQR